MKYVEHTIAGSLECGSCNCKDVLICLFPDTLIQLADNTKMLRATIDSCEPAYSLIGTVVTYDACGKQITSGNFKTTTKIVLKYNENLLTDPENNILESDISCISVDSCILKKLDLNEQAESGAVYLGIAEGSANIRTVLPDPEVTALLPGKVYSVEIPVGGANTGSATLDIGTIGPKNIIDSDTDLALLGGELNGLCLFSYSAVNDVLVLINPTGADNTILSIAAGTVNARTATGNPTVKAYIPGRIYVSSIPANGANTGASTFNIDGLGAKTVFDGETDAALVGGEMNGTCAFLFSGTADAFILLNPTKSESMYLGTVVGTDTYTITSGLNLKSYVPGRFYTINVPFGQRNSTAATLNVDALGAVSIRNGSHTGECASNQISGVCVLMYTGSVFLLLNPKEYWDTYVAGISSGVDNGSFTQALKRVSGNDVYLNLKFEIDITVASAQILVNLPLTTPPIFDGIVAGQTFGTIFAIQSYIDEASNLIILRKMDGTNFAIGAYEFGITGSYIYRN